MRFTQHGCLNLEQDIRVLVTKLSDLFPDVPVSFLFWKKNNMQFVISCFLAGEKHFFASSSDFLRSER